MTDAEFEALPYGSEGLWRKLMHASREKASLEEILTAVKSKRYTRSRLDRMVMCAFLGITRETMAMEIPDMASPATITSLVHERAYRGKQELQHRQEAKADTRRKVGKALRTKYEAAGLALLQMPDAE